MASDTWESLLGGVSLVIKAFPGANSEAITAGAWDIRFQLCFETSALMRVNFQNKKKSQTKKNLISNSANLSFQTVLEKLSVEMFPATINDST